MYLCRLKIRERPNQIGNYRDWSVSAFRGDLKHFYQVSDPLGA